MLMNSDTNSTMTRVSKVRMFVYFIKGGSPSGTVLSTPAATRPDSVAGRGHRTFGIWGLPFLSSRVVAIEIEVYLVKPFLAVPGQRPHQGALLGIVVQFASRCSFEEIKVDVAVVVGHGALFGMAVETGEGGNQPNPYSPRLPHGAGSPVRRRHRKK